MFVGKGNHTLSKSKSLLQKVNHILQKVNHTLQNVNYTYGNQITLTENKSHFRKGNHTCGN
jgi:hypothetical protein